MKRLLITGGFILGMASTAMAQQSSPVIDVLKQASCGCCGGWDDLWACHTSTVAGYTVEGHVPAREIARLLEERPAALGIATPGMPTGSPGMDYGTARDAFDVVLVELDSSQQIFASYPGN